jgi:fumarylacetoacetase
LAVGVPVPAGSDFTIDNLPYGAFWTPAERRRVGVAIGEHILDLSVVLPQGRVAGVVRP